MARAVLNRVTFLVFTVLAGAVGILSWLGVSPPWFDDGVASRDQGLTPRGAGVPDPYMFVEFDSVTPQREQECTGLIGLCLGQPVDLAYAALGDSQADGFPQNVTPSEYQVDTRCNRWALSRLTSIDVCDRNGSISKISLTFSGEPPRSLSMPPGFVLRFPDTLDNVATDLTSEYRTQPFKSFYAFGEGEYVSAFSWFFPSDVEGSPEVRVSIDGRSIDGAADEPVPCDPEQVQFAYDDVLQAAAGIHVETVEVSLVSDHDLSVAPCP